MYNINLVCTRHQECGNCNSEELYSIIENIGPEIVFEELSDTNFEMAYHQHNLVTVEIAAIKQYLLNHQVKHIPVDTYPLSDSYHKEVDQMLDKLVRGTSQNSFQLRSLLNSQFDYTSQHGFRYLNSEYHDNLIEELYNLRESIINEINDENCVRIANLEREMNKKREVEILSNIYKYSNNNLYEQALMFIGAGHRKSIFKLIEKFENQEELKLNWILWK